MRVRITRHWMGIPNVADRRIFIYFMKIFYANREKNLTETTFMLRLFTHKCFKQSKTF